jgi:hypothetical protein
MKSMTSSAISRHISVVLNGTSSKYYAASKHVAANIIRENNFQTILLQTTPIFGNQHLQIV